VTRRVVLIGRPLRRRHSELMHNAAFEHFGVDATYQLLPLQPEELDRFFATARGDDWLGFQVTAPYKTEALKRCDRVDADAARVGAVNSAVCASGTIEGFNTDLSGFLGSVTYDLGMNLREAKVVVVGAGGAARAVVVACLQGGAREVVVANRTIGRALDLATDSGSAAVTAVQTASDEMTAALSAADLAVNATTVGMTTPGLPFDVTLLPAWASVFDLVYIPVDTDLVCAARARGLAATGGAGMLVRQAEAAFRRWTGLSGAETVMRNAIADLLKSTEQTEIPDRI
jgi:shikimate dehydrogenase